MISGRAHGPAARAALASWLVLATATAVLAGGGCKRPEDGRGQREGGAASLPFSPLPREPGRLVSSEGRISVPIPEGEDWTCSEERHGEGEAAAIALRCRRTDPGEFLFLSAKTHRQPADQRVDAETVLMTLYRADNEAFFESLRTTSDGPTTLAGAPAWQAELEAVHATLGAIRKRERLAIVGDRIFAISAEGKPELWQAHAPLIEEWFEAVTFALQ